MMESPYMPSVEEMVSQLEYEARVYDNKTARQYLSSLQQYLDSVTVTYMYLEETPNYDTYAGIAWVIAVPTIFFISVAIVMVLLLVLFQHSENFKTETRSRDQADVADNTMRSSSRADAENIHGPELAVVVDCHGNTATNKGGAFLRGYVNAAGELEGASRASGASKGSVRSLGVLTDLNDGKLERPHLHGQHFHPPSAPSTLTRRGLTTFEMLARQRLSRSIDELRDLTERGRQAVIVPSEWSSLGTIGGRTSLEMNVTSETPQLTLLESDLATQELPSSKRFSNSIDSLNENASRDSLRASMEFHRSKGSGSGLGPDDLYRPRKRNSDPLAGDSMRKSDDLKKGYSLSSSSLDTASRSGSKLGNINLSFVKSDGGSANSQVDSNTYVEIINFNKLHFRKSDEHVNYVNCVARPPYKRGFDNPLFSQSTNEPATLENAQKIYDNVEGTAKRQINKESGSVKVLTNTVGSSTGDMITVGRGTMEPRQPQKKYPERAFPSQTIGSSPSSSDFASSSYRSRSPLQREHPLSLEMLSAWSEDIENHGKMATLNATRKPVTRRLFATTPQMANKKVEDYSLFEDSASRSVPTRKPVDKPFDFELKQFVPLKVSAPGVQRHNTNHKHCSSRNNTQESSIYSQETSDSIAKCESLLKGEVAKKTAYTPDGYLFHEIKEAKIDSKVIPENLLKSHANPQQGQAVLPNNQKYSDIQKSSLTQLGDAYITTNSDLSAGSSPSTSPDSSEHHSVNRGQTGSSADSTIESISSSLAPFHAKRVDELGMPIAKYRLPREIRTSESEPDEDITSASNTKPELNASLEPNRGSCNNSLEETGCLPSSDVFKNPVRKDVQHITTPSQTGSVSARKPPLGQIPRRHGSLMELARDVFSRPSYALATAAAAPSSPGQSLELEKSTLSAESVSDGILTDRRVTAEQRLSEYGFIKSLAGKSTFVINPSPGRFSARTGTAELGYAGGGRGNEVFDFTNSMIEGTGHADSYFEQDIKSCESPTKQVVADFSASIESDLHIEKQPFHPKTNMACGSCKNSDFQEYEYVDGNNNSVAEEPTTSSYVSEDAAAIAVRPSVQTLAYRFQQRANTK